MSTRAATILELEAVTFIEPSFAALTDPLYTDLLARDNADEGRMLVDERNDPVAVAFHEPGGWIAGSFTCRPASVALIDAFEQVNGEIYQEDRAVWEAAIREYFSLRLAAEVPAAMEDLNPARKGILADVITGVWGKGAGETCIDCGCGSGVGSLVLRELGFTPLSYDNDASLLTLGIGKGRLLPEETMCIDATQVAAYTRPVPRGIGIMMGEINSFSQEMWQQIANGLFSVTGETLITVGTEPEALQIREWGNEAGRPVEIRENPGDSFYDHWVCIARPAGTTR
ncbi:hypothetical protein [Methanoregula sp.]|uniref:hypothetical protein n=1 Tax=Methanoregula sp. TaxID=2052170 RepID=UPI002BD9C9D6|nr:hypothetical protein [Methanoregula sp.]HVP96248.1 hypothetical protein [Methanoregula sp.]